MTPVQFTVGHKHFPDFYLGVAAIDQRQLRTNRKHFTVQRQLNLAVSWKRGNSKLEANNPLHSYLPGEVAEIQVRATDQLGQPVKADFSLALVDEALFAVYKDAVMSINDFFQIGIRRETEMRTTSSCAFLYISKTQQVNQEILEEGRRLELSVVEAVHSASELRSYTNSHVTNVSRIRARRRVRQSIVGAKRFADEPQVREESTYAGHWIGSVITDDTGLATVTIPMPEKTAKWRLTGRGSTVDTLVGQVTVNVITQQQFFIDVQTPRVLQNEMYSG